MIGSIDEQYATFGTGSAIWSRRQLLLKYMSYFQLVAGESDNLLGENGGALGFKKKKSLALCLSVINYYVLLVT